MKKILSALFILLIGLPTINACTTFLINKNGRLAFGRNYDWVTASGMVCTNQRGLLKTSAQSASLTWVSQYGSVSFNQYGKEFPTGGMNEKGLVVELMWLEGSEYPKPDERPAVGVLQWIQYQLDNCSTIDEVIATDKKLRISPANPPLHYLVADATGQATTIEFLKGQMVIHKGTNLPLPVLTNTDYATSYKLVKESNETGGNKSVSFNDNSVQRFATACSMVQQYQLNDNKQSVIDFSFDVLKKVSQHEFTRWSIVYDITNKAVYFKTNDFQQIKSVSYADIDFSCKAPSLTYNMNQAASGNVIKQFAPFTNEVNTRLINQSVEESRREVNISEADKKRTIDYAATVKCG